MKCHFNTATQKDFIIAFGSLSDFKRIQTTSTKRSLCVDRSNGGRTMHMCTSFNVHRERNNGMLLPFLVLFFLV